MSSILEILNIEELKIRKNNLLYQLERIDNELEKRENNKEVKQKLDDHESCDNVFFTNISCDHVSSEKDIQKPDEKPKIMKIKIKKKEQSS
jgi:hypothetical protein